MSTWINNGLRPEVFALSRTVRNSDMALSAADTLAEWRCGYTQ
jgi:hypothetical protein